MKTELKKDSELEEVSFLKKSFREKLKKKANSERYGS